MNRFSIVIPVDWDNQTENEVQRFEDTLASVLRSRPHQAQILVVHDGSYQDPHGLGSEVDWIVESSSSLANQFDLAVTASSGEWIVLIRPGVELDEGWEHPVEQAFENPQTGSLTPLIVPSSQPARITVAGVDADAAGTRQLLGCGQKLYGRSLQRLTPLGPSSHFGIYRRSIISAIGRLGCLTEDIYLDVELALSLQALGFSNQLCSEIVATVDRESRVQAESRQPHGTTAERSLYRYGRQGRSSRWARTLLDMARSPLQSWRLRHGLQRLTSQRDRSADQSFRRHLAIIKHTESWRETALPESIPGTAERRAA
ncbi:MAG: hypothetical protein MK108_08490 [Mariniblastus sp.]|nr:hypothetical protein [Mariniblastus sp.]